MYRKGFYPLLNFPLLLFAMSIMLFSINNPTQAQVQKSDIRGYVKDAKSGEALPYANILIMGTNHGTTTNTDGYFVLVNEPVGVCSLLVRYIGYRSQTLRVDNKPDNSALLSIKLNPTVIEMQGISVTAQAEMLEATKHVSQMTISPRQISSLPNIGEVDVFRTLQLLPGVSAANDGSSGLYIRGGTPDQNLILFDGMTIYHVDHFFGFFSAFNADAIKDIQLFKGCFDAKYGGRLSSVVNITGKSGDQNRVRFGYGVNLLSGRSSFEMPLGKWGTFLIAGRRSYTDFIRSPLYDKIYGMLTGDQNGGATGTPVRGFGGGPGRFGGQQQADFKPSFYFYDLNSKLTLHPSSKDVLTFSLYSGKDNLDKSQDLSNLSFRMRDSGDNASLQTTDFTRWGNLGFSGKWSRQWHNRFHINILAAHSKYFSQYDRSSNMSGVTPPAQSDSSTMRRSFDNASKEENNVWDTSYKTDMDWQIVSSHRLGFGFQLSHFNNEYNAVRNDTIPIFSRNRQAALAAFYLQDKWKIKAAELTLGLRSSHYDKTSQIYNEPRASFSIPILKNVNFRAAWGQYYQFVNQISNEDVTQGARDFWLLADEDFDPGFAEHRILGLNYENTGYVFSVEAYQKNLDNLIEFSRRYVAVGFGPGPETPRRGTAPVENFFIGSGDARGVEFLLQKKRGALTGWLGYTLGKVDYNFPALNNGQTYPAMQDRRHEVNVVAKYQLGVWTLAATWVFASGSPYTSPESQYYITLLDGTSQSYIHVSDKNANRLPDYHRLDISGSRKWETEHWETEIGVSIFNLYNHKNIWYRDYNLDTVPVTITDVTMLGLTPTIYIQMKLK